jgi:hypothetical protein
MKGFIKYNDITESQDLISSINNCLGFPQGETTTWDTTTAICTVGPTSAYTEFWGYIVKVDTDQMGQCLTQEQINSIIEIPEDCNICGV